MAASKSLRQAERIAQDGWPDIVEAMVAKAKKGDKWAADLVAKHVIKGINDRERAKPKKQTTSTLILEAIKLLPGRQQQKITHVLSTTSNDDDIQSPSGVVDVDALPGAIQAAGQAGGTYTRKHPPHKISSKNTVLETYRKRQAEKAVCRVCGGECSMDSVTRTCRNCWRDAHHKTRREFRRDEP